MRFLISAFGFEEVAVYEGEDEGTIGHAELRWQNGGGLMLHTAGGNSVGDLAEQR